ncbi:hypothetical protein BX666DRAFT_1882373 [Dichotomocladium elegans]|nr:hypothetical protein BX666DRAFT_1882373 [Dichotomocladium elegans]
MTQLISQDDDAFAWLLEYDFVEQREQQHEHQLYTHNAPLGTPGAIPLIPLQSEPYVPLRDPPLTAHNHHPYQHIASCGPDSQLKIPSKVRKKPGPKPNPLTPALRKIQNRAAQRAFRARREQRFKDLEDRIAALESECKSKDAALLLADQDSRALKAECYYLKGMSLTLLLVCLHHDILIPDHFPYILSEDTLSEFACKSPYAISAYIEAHRQYEENMQELVRGIMSENNASVPDSRSSSLSHDCHGRTDDIRDFRSNYATGASSTSRDDAVKKQTVNEGGQQDSMSSSEHQSHERDGSRHDAPIAVSAAAESVPAHPMQQAQQDCALTDLVLQLKIQSKLLGLSAFNCRLRPTYLQLLIPHDVRIDILPNPCMRDRLIVFRNLVDVEKCVSTLFSGSRFIGDDPTSPGDWELPVKFLQEYWYICMKYRHRKVAGWDQLERLINVQDALF